VQKVADSGTAGALRGASRDGRAAVRYGASLRVYEDCFVLEDVEGAIAVTAV
jgi:hypothetical protein